MPLYEYVCAQCGRFELLQRVSDSPLKACPTCGGEVHKAISAPAIQFKGTGWYVTDYARKAAPKDAGSSKAEPASTSAPKDSSTSSSTSTPTQSSSTDRSATGSSPAK